MNVYITYLKLTSLEKANFGRMSCVVLCKYSISRKAAVANSKKMLSYINYIKLVLLVYYYSRCCSNKQNISRQTCACGILHYIVNTVESTYLMIFPETEENMLS